MSFKFTPKMFADIPLPDSADEIGLLIRRVSAQANAALAAHLETCSKIYGGAEDCWWHLDKSSVFKPTHTALLFNVELLKAEPCKHKPREPGLMKSSCVHCNVIMTAEWKAKEPCE